MAKKKKSNKKENKKKPSKKEVKKDEGKKKVKPAEKETEKHERILKNILIGIGVLIAIIFIGYLIVQSLYTINVEGVEFEIKNFCDNGPCLTTYHTTVPIIYQGAKAEYNFYLRNDPRKLIEDVPFEGDLILRKNMFVKVTFDKHCEGFETIAMQNFLNLHRVAEINTLSGANESCDPSKGMYVVVQEANETYISQPTPGCYEININQCEILEGTERFMVETFIELDKVTN